MTVEVRSTEAKVTYDVNQLVKGDTFDIKFKFLENDEMLTVTIRRQDETTEDLVLDTDYQVIYTNGNNNIWGQIVMLDDFEGVDNICIHRTVPISQDRQFNTQTVFAVTVEGALDKLTIILQDIRSLLERTLHAPVDDILPEGATELPPASDGEGYLVRDDKGNYRIKDSAGQSKALRQSPGEIADPSFVLHASERAGKFITFDPDTAEVVLKDASEIKAQEQSDWNEVDDTKVTYIKNKPEIKAQEQSDWNEVDDTKVTFIKNKPDIPKVVNVLDDTSIDKALSANMGKTLNENKQNKLIAGANILMDGDIISAIFSGDPTSIHWETDILPVLSFWNSLSFGNSIFVGFSSSTRYVLRSTNGKNWQKIELSSDVGNLGWSDVCYVKDKWVACAKHTNKMVYSTTGITWTISNFTDVKQWIALTGSGVYFIALASDGTVNRSTNGIDWNVFNINSGEANTWVDICFGKNKFVALSSTGGIAYSISGTTWTFLKSLQDNVSWSKIVYGEGVFVVIGQNSNVVAISTDAITWEILTLPIAVDGNTLCYGQSLFLALTDGNNAVISCDGQKWETIDIQATGDWKALAFGMDMFIALDYNSNILLRGQHLDYKEYNGILPIVIDNKANTVKINMATDDSFGVIKPDGSTITVSEGVLTAVNSGGKIYTGMAPITVDNDANTIGINVATNDGLGVVKPDGTTITASGGVLTAVNSGGKTYTGTEPITVDNNTNKIGINVATNDGLGVVKPDGSTITVSNGVLTVNLPKTANFDEVTLPASRHWQSICHGKAGYVAIANDSNNGTFSTDGKNWEEITLPSNGYWQSICHGEAGYVAIESRSDKGAFSVDGKSWEAITLPASREWFFICYGDAGYVVIASNSDKVAFSIDGKKWEEITLPASRLWRSVCHGNVGYVAIALNSDKGAFSTDGKNWEEVTLSEKREWLSVCYGNVGYYGESGYVAIANNSDKGAFSTDGKNWEEITLPASGYWQSICHGEAGYIAIADSSDRGAISVNGKKWKEITLPSNGYWQSICQGEAGYVAIESRSDKGALGSLIPVNLQDSYNEIDHNANTLITANLALLNISYPIGSTYVNNCTDADYFPFNVPDTAWDEIGSLTDSSGNTWYLWKRIK